jgi:hypothetical protein
MVAEYIAVSTATADGMMLLKLLDESGILVRPVAVLCDNVAATKVFSNPVENAKVKCLEHCHCAPEWILAGRFVVHWISTHEQLADSFTKALTGPELTLKDLDGYIRICSKHHCYFLFQRYDKG